MKERPSMQTTQNLYRHAQWPCALLLAFLLLIGAPLYPALAGTQVRQVKDINATNHTPGAYPYNLTTVGNTVYFSAYNGINGSELWKSDGTAAGTMLVKQIDPGETGYAYLGNLTAVDNTLFFTVADATHGVELWRSDGSTKGTALVKDINPGVAGASPSALTNINGTLFFDADDGVHGRELWTSDGTDHGTALAYDLAPGIYSSTPVYFTV